MHRRLLVLDIDGTLLTSAHTILPSTVDALRSAIDQGHIVVPASSRPPESVRRIAAELSPEVRTLITLNGGLVVDSEESFSLAPIGESGMPALLDCVRELGLHASVYSGWDWFIDSDDEWGREEARIVGFSPTFVPALHGILDHPVQKVLVIGPPPLADEFIARIGVRSPDLRTARSKPHYCEVVASGVSKVTAIERVCTVHGLTMSDVVAFGDGENDLEMIQAAGIGVAMGNSFPCVLAAADMVTDTNDADGIAKALGRIRLQTADCRPQP